MRDARREAWKHRRWLPRYIACIYQRANFRWRNGRYRDKWISQRQDHGLYREWEDNPNFKRFIK